MDPSWETVDKKKGKLPVTEGERRGKKLLPPYVKKKINQENKRLDMAQEITEGIWSRGGALNQSEKRRGRNLPSKKRQRAGPSKMDGEGGDYIGRSKKERTIDSFRCWGHDIGWEN